MTKNLCVALWAILALDNAVAATGNFQMLAGGSFHNRGYCKGGERTPAYGTNCNQYLSDGKEVLVFAESLHALCCTWKVHCTVGGFTENPTSSYITSISVNSCDTAPNAFSAASATNSYSAITGKATCMFAPHAGCMHSGGYYDVLCSDDRS